jgi:hypothetical protein
MADFDGDSTKLLCYLARDALLLTPVEPPVTVALYTLLGARLALGLGVAYSV